MLPFNPFMIGFPGLQAIAEHEREEEARKLAQSIQRARMGILPYRKPQRGQIGYWWRRKWRFKALNPIAYDLRKLNRAILRARAEGRL